MMTEPAINYEELEKQSCKQFVDRLKKDIESFTSVTVRAVKITHDYTFEETGGRDQNVILALDYAAIKYRLRYFKGEVEIKSEILLSEEIEFIVDHMNL